MSVTIVNTAPGTDATDPKKRPFRPYGAAEKLFDNTGDEILMSGPAGTGKSRACLELMYILATNYPGMRGLIVRKTRESLSEAALVTWEEKVVPPGDPILQGAKRRFRQSYDFANGSTIVVGGMDKASKVMSTEYDAVYVQEAIELVEDDWESLTTRLRNGKIPHRQQIIADTNPDKPSHWLKKRCDAGRTSLIECRHSDNPVLFDHVTGEWTPAGVAYIAKLDALTGPRMLRLRHGRWVQAEGVVYSEWDAAIHLIDRFDIPADWKRIVSIDFGWNDPFVALFWAIDPEGRMYLYRQHVRTHRLVEDHARDLLAYIAEDGVDISGIVCDHDREGRETLVRHLGRANFAARKEIEEGIQAVKSRLRVQGDGKPRLFVLRDSLVGRDANLTESKKPIGFSEEIDGYIWNPSAAKNKGEEPLDKDNHVMDACRYAVRFVDDGAGVWTVSGSQVNDHVLVGAPAGVFNSRTTPEGEDEPFDVMQMTF